MKINELKYERTWNLGSYESEKIACQAVVEEGENAEQVLREIIEFVTTKGRHQEHQKGVQKAPETLKRDSAPVEEIIRQGESREESKDAQAPSESSQEKKRRGRPPMVKPPSAIQIASTPAPSEQLELVPEVVEPPAVVVEAPPAVQAKVDKKTTPYNRSIELHKKIVAENLDRHFPNWKSNAGKAKLVSEALEGKPFLDNEGRILQSFVDQLVSAMSA